MSEAAGLPRLRQAVIAARDLPATVERLRAQLGFGAPFADPGVGHFGLKNAVFALGDTFFEVVSPARDDTAAGRLLARRGTDACGYMLMFQVDALAPARERISAAGVRVVFEVPLDDISEVHLHPADMRGAIVSLSEPRPPSAWRWGGPDWEQRSVAGVRVAGARVAVSDAASVSGRWRSVIGGLPGIEFEEDPAEPGVVEIVLAGGDAREPLQIDGLRLKFTDV